MALPPITGHLGHLNPDPTVMTMEAIDRQITMAVDIARRDTAQLQELIEARIDAIDKATAARVEVWHRSLSDVDRAVGNAKALFGERFDSIQMQLLERDKRFVAAETFAQSSVAMALQAQRDMASSVNESNASAVRKSEDATVKQIDSIVALLAQNTRAIDEKIAAISSRLDRGDGGTSSRTIDGQIAQLTARLDRGDGGTNGRQMQQSSAITIVAAVIAAVSLAFAGVALIRPTGGVGGNAVPQISVTQPAATGLIAPAH